MTLCGPGGMPRAQGGLADALPLAGGRAPSLVVLPELGQAPLARRPAALRMASAPASPRRDAGAPDRTVRVVRETGRRGSPPGPQARRPRQDRATTARAGPAHGHHAQEDPPSLHHLPPGHPREAANRDPRGVVTRELRAGKLARVARTGDRWKRTRTRQAPRQRPTGAPAGSDMAAHLLSLFQQ